jgi:hypothetical protein
VRNVDVALATLHLAMNQTQLLRLAAAMTTSANGGEEEILMDPALDGSILANNDGAGEMRFTPAAAGNPVTATGVLQHEIGHNWDLPWVNPWWAKGHDFHALSGWDGRVPPDAPAPAGKRVSDDGLWFYADDAGFVTDYARTNPREDFAESLLGWFDYTSTEAKSDGWQAKWDYINAFLVDLQGHPQGYF